MGLLRVSPKGRRWDRLDAIEGKNRKPSCHLPAIRQSSIASEHRIKELDAIGAMNTQCSSALCIRLGTCFCYDKPPELHLIRNCAHQARSGNISSLSSPHHASTGIIERHAPTVSTGTRGSLELLE